MPMFIFTAEFRKKINFMEPKSYRLSKWSPSPLSHVRFDIRKRATSSKKIVYHVWTTCVQRYGAAGVSLLRRLAGSLSLLEATSYRIHGCHAAQQKSNVCDAYHHTTALEQQWYSSRCVFTAVDTSPIESALHGIRPGNELSSTSVQSVRAALQQRSGDRLY